MGATNKDRQEAMRIGKPRTRLGLELELELEQSRTGNTGLMTDSCKGT